MKKYYVHENGIQQGPFDVEDLKGKNIKRNTPIWFSELPEWTTADKIKELQILFTSYTLPPYKEVVINNNSSKIDDGYGNSKSGFTTWARFLRFAAGVFLLILGIVAIKSFISKDDTSSTNSLDSYTQKIMTIEEIEKTDPVRFLDASGTYKPTFWGDKFILNIKIENAATVAKYKDVVIKINYYSTTESIISSEEHTFYDYFLPTSSKTFELRVNKSKDCITVGWDVIRATAAN